MQSTFKAILSDALANRPAPDTSVIRIYRGMFYAVDQNSAWVLKWRDDRAYWQTDYRMSEDTHRLVSNLAGGDGSFPLEDGCPTGYLVECEDRGVTQKFWYQSLVDACVFATGVGAHPEHGHPTVVKIEAYDWISA